MGKRALVMSGGGARGAFEAAAAKYLIDQGADFDVIAGVSVGALNAALLAQGKGPEGLKWQAQALVDLWLNITGESDFFRGGLLRKIRALMDRTGMYDLEPTRRKIAERVNPDALRQSGRQFRIGAVDIESGHYVVAGQGTENIHAWILASASMPVAFPAVHIGGRQYVDGGIRNQTPLREAFHALIDAGGGNPEDPDELYVVMASPLTLPPLERPVRNAIDVALRTLEIAVDEMLREDILYAIAVNRQLRAGRDLEKKLGAVNLRPEAISFAVNPLRPPRRRWVKIWGIAPSKAYQGYLDLSPAKIREAIAAGFEAAESPLDQDQLEKLLQRQGVMGGTGLEPVTSGM